jgi:hypothetical protein
LSLVQRGSAPSTTNVAAATTGVKPGAFGVLKKKSNWAYTMLLTKKDNQMAIHAKRSPRSMLGCLAG